MHGEPDITDRQREVVLVLELAAAMEELKKPANMYDPEVYKDIFTIFEKLDKTEAHDGSLFILSVLYFTLASYLERLSSDKKFWDSILEYAQENDYYVTSINSGLPVTNYRYRILEAAIKCDSKNENNYMVRYLFGKYLMETPLVESNNQNFNEAIKYFQQCENICNRAKILIKKMETDHEYTLVDDGRQLIKLARAHSIDYYGSRAASENRLAKASVHCVLL